MNFSSLKNWYLKNWSILSVIKYIHVDLSILFHNHPFSVCGICSDRSIPLEHSKFLANLPGIDEYWPFTLLNGRNAAPVIFLFFYSLNWKLTSIFTRIRITCSSIEKCPHSYSSYLMLPSQAISVIFTHLSRERFCPAILCDYFL